MAKLVALLDSVGYQNADGETMYAAKGESFEPNEDSAKRVQEMGAAAPAGSAEAKEAQESGEADTGPDPGVAAEDELSKMSKADLVEHAEGANIANADKMSKAELVAAIQAAGAISTFKA